MPATAGRCRMPANNRVHSSAALQTHGIWQSAIGYDPYAPDKAGGGGAAPGGGGGGGGGAAAAPEGAVRGAPAAADDKDNAYDSFQGLLQLAKLTGSNADEARGACRKCHRVGHLTFQCRNFLTAKEDVVVPADVAGGLTELEAVRKRAAERKAEGKDVAAGSKAAEAMAVEEEETDLSESSEESETERILAEEARKRGLLPSKRNGDYGIVNGSSKKSSEKKSSKDKKRRKTKRHESSDDSESESEDSEEERRRRRKERRKRKEKERGDKKKKKGRHHDSDESDSEVSDKDKKRRHKKSSRRKH